MVETITPLPQRRRWLQFRLRTLLVAITVLAIPLGVIVERAERQRRAVERIESLGGTVWYDYQYGVNAKGETTITMNMPHPTSFSWARRLLGDHYFDTVWHVNAIEWRPVPQTPTFQHFMGPTPMQTKLSQAPTQAIGAIGQLRHLKSLDLCKSRTTDADLKYLTPLTRLERLELNDTLVTDAGLQSLSHSKQLKHLNIRDTGVTAGGVSDLRQRLPNCDIQTNAVESATRNMPPAAGASPAAH